MDLLNCLPFSFKTHKEQEYFAFLAYHILTMSFVYFNIWRITGGHAADITRLLQRLVGKNALTQEGQG